MRDPRKCEGVGDALGRAQCYILLAMIETAVGGYVRARNLLVFSGAQSRVTPWGAIQTHSPSRFILESAKEAGE